MRAIIVDDEPLMLRRFVRLSAALKELRLVGQFGSAKDALAFAQENRLDAAFLDVDMPVANGIELARELRKLRPDLIIVFVTAHDEYLWEFNQLGGDYYLLKPYTQQTLAMAMERLCLLRQRQQKSLCIRTFGQFVVLKDGKPLPLTGKPKEILALVVLHRGKEITNSEIYSTIWEGRPHGNVEMTVYYNALRKLKQMLQKEGIEDLLVSTSRGQMINTGMFDCDFYDWQDKQPGSGHRFEGECMSEYPWGEKILSEILGWRTSNRA